jgi:ABC-type multidrug transport system permease subunit
VLIELQRLFDVVVLSLFEIVILCFVVTATACAAASFVVVLQIRWLCGVAHWGRN